MAGSSKHRERVAIPVFRAKLRPPAVSGHYVLRARLLELLDELVAVAPLTIIVAPAGTGKTSLLSGWARRSTASIGWLSLDETDRDATQFWSGVISAIEGPVPGCGERARAVLRRRGGAMDAMGQLLADLDAEDHPQVVLVIDDLHLADDDGVVAASLSQFVAHLPRRLHVVLATRHQPKLPLGRLRARGHLGEVGYAELRFSHHEAVELIWRLLPAASADQLETLALRSDGWAASLQLAAIAGRSARARPGGDVSPVWEDTQIPDYVLHEVLAYEDPELVEALMDVSVVDRVNPGLARALTGRADAGELLVRAEARGLFVTQVVPEGWFEIHALVRDALLSKLSATSPTRLADLHASAARWFQDAGEVVLALEHLLLGGQARSALRLLAAHQAELYDTGREATIMRVIAAIPEGVFDEDLESMIDFAWCHLLVSRRRYLEIVDQVTWWASRSEATSESRARLIMLQAVAAHVSGKWAEGGALARQGLQAMGDGWWRDPLGRFGWNDVSRDIALSERWDDTSDEVREASHSLQRDPQGRVSFEGTRALGHALAGRPIDALRVAGGVRHAADVPNMTILRAELALAEALAHRELGDRARATSELQALAATPMETMLFVRVLASVTLVEALLDDGDIEGASAAFTATRALVEAESFEGGGRNWLGRAGVLVCLAGEDVVEARNWSAQVDDPFWGGITSARGHLAEVNLPLALACLETVVPRCARHEVILSLVRARAVGAHHDEALKYACRAIEQATACGMLQTVVSESPEVIGLVEASAWRAPNEWMDRFRRAAAAGARPPARGAGTNGATRATLDLVEPLTQRELDVVRFLASRLTVSEIANELYISQNTLKFHLKVIYRKLGVSSRAEA
ncbi:MAG TPA: LuxR C-terminal-related transcriptional regulator, partial [Acidimicrobiales bacterium]|nr:LuxR C-terminal-related transcriptional regulator [Acidimicrobiales bacterium]